MNRLRETVASCRARGRKTLAVFLTAGYPSLGSTIPLIKAIDASGADIIEIGVPFSDPIADGPVIQASSETALRNGITLAKIFTSVSEIRKSLSIPIVLMGYANPIFAFGREQFINRAVETGVDGVIIPDLTLEEGTEFREQCRMADISSILLTAPTTPAERVRLLDEASTGFLYCVSSTGVTGARTDLAASAREYLTSLRRIVRHNPLLVGFGITTASDAGSIAEMCDGVIIGTALINTIEQNHGNAMIPAVSSFIAGIRTALDRTTAHV